MKKNSLVSWVLAGSMLVTASADVLACGDKFLVTARGARYQRGRTTRPAGVLLYAGVATNLAQGLQTLSVDSILKQAGHKVVRAGSAGELDQALSAGGVDVVMADLADATVVETRLGSLAGRPTVLPVLYNASKKELSDARRTFLCALNAPPKKHNLIDAIEEAVELKDKAAKKSSGR